MGASGADGDKTLAVEKVPSKGMMAFWNDFVLGTPDSPYMTELDTIVRKLFKLGDAMREELPALSEACKLQTSWFRSPLLGSFLFHDVSFAVRIRAVQWA
jgi:hypothetical protein